MLRARALMFLSGKFRARRKVRHYDVMIFERTSSAAYSSLGDVSVTQSESKLLYGEYGKNLYIFRFAN